MQYTCSICKVLKDSTVFGRDKQRKNGLSGRCKPCINASQNRRGVKIKEKGKATWGLVKHKVEERFKNEKCLDCGGHFPWECMDFDHRDPTLKKIAISNYGTYIATEGVMNKVNNEIAKCDLVCANCHRIRTKKQRDAGAFKKNQYVKT